MPVVENTVTKPGGGLFVGARVRIRLYAASDGTLEAAYDVAADRTIVSELYLLTDAAGVWSVDLQANSTITPANTVYEIVEGINARGEARYYVEVPDTAGPLWAGDLIVLEPAALLRLSAANLPFTPTGALVATDVQAAIEEVSAEAVRLAGTETITGLKTFTSRPTFQGAAGSGESTLYKQGAGQTGWAAKIVDSGDAIMGGLAVGSDGLEVRFKDYAGVRARLRATAANVIIADADNGGLVNLTAANLSTSGSGGDVIANSIRPYTHQGTLLLRSEYNGQATIAAGTAARLVSIGTGAVVSGVKLNVKAESATDEVLRVQSTSAQTGLLLAARASNGDLKLGMNDGGLLWINGKIGATANAAGGDSGSKMLLSFDTARMLAYDTYTTGYQLVSNGGGRAPGSYFGPWGTPATGDAYQQVGIIPLQASARALVVKAASAQSVSLVEYQDSAGTVLSAVGSNGSLLPPSITLNRVTGDNGVLLVRGAAETNHRLQVNANGIIRWGDGTNAVDTELDRAAAGVLRVVQRLRFDGGIQWGAAALEQTTVGAAGGASALPATPTKFLKVVDSAGTTLVIPAYTAA